jgi:sugar lactone lactonase YvrE
MRNRTLFLNFFLWAAALAAGPLPVLPAPPASYVYLHLDQENGLASNHVLAVLQDRQGYLWLGTSNGLQRYDGRQFLHYRHEPGNPNSLPADLVESLLEDPSGNIWIVSGGRVARFAPPHGTFRPVKWTERVQPPTTGSNSNAMIKGASGCFPAIRRRPSPMTPPSKPLSGPIGSTFRAPIPPERPTTGNWLPSPSPEPYCFLEDSRGIVWAGSTQLLARYPGATGFAVVPRRKALRYGIDYSVIFCLTEDREGTLWVGTDQGVYYFNPKKQHFFSPSPPDPARPGAVSPAATGFLETADGNIWASSLRGGIRVYDRQFQPLACYLPGTGKNRPIPVWGMVQDRQGVVWAGVENGLLRMTPGRNAIGEVHLPGLAGQTLLKGVLAPDGFSWWGTSGGSILRWDSRREQGWPLPVDGRFRPWGRIQGILADAKDSLWIATAGAGIYQVSKHTGRVGDHYGTDTRPGVLLSNQVGSLQWHTDGTLLVSTSAGLHFIDVKAKKVRTQTTADGLPANAILNVAPGRDGSLLLTTQYSLFRWNVRTGRAQSFGARDGIPDQSYAFSTAYRLSDGRVLLGTVHDFFYFHPDSLSDAQPPPPVRITGLRIFNQPVRVDSAIGPAGELRLSHGQNFFTVEFASLHYYDDARIRYQYQLEGVDAGWVEAGPNRFAPYTDVAGGNYRFKVKAVRDDGLATPGVTTLAIRVGQPFWKTGWFLGAVGLALAGAGYGLYRVRINRLLALERVRTRIARDLHDDMGSTLSTINILAAMARQQAAENPVKTEGYLEKISTYSQSMMETMDDIVWSVNPVNDTVQNLVARMREFGREILEPKDIAFALHAEGLLPSVPCPSRSGTIVS